MNLAKNGNIGWGDYGIRYTGAHTAQYNFVIPWRDIRIFHRSGSKLVLVLDEVQTDHRVELSLFDKGAAVMVEALYHFLAANRRLPSEAELSALEQKSRRRSGGYMKIAGIAVVLLFVLPAGFSLLNYLFSTPKNAYSDNVLNRRFPNSRLPGSNHYDTVERVVGDPIDGGSWSNTRHDWGSIVRVLDHPICISGLSFASAGSQAGPVELTIDFVPPDGDILYALRARSDTSALGSQSKHFTPFKAYSIEINFKGGGPFKMEGLTFSTSGC
jgi:hypothetical protein